MDNLNVILSIVAGLVGFPAFLSALINVAKYFGLADGLASVVNFWAHVAVYVAVAVAVFTGKIDIVGNLDLQLGSIAQLLLAVLSFLSSLGIAKAFHKNVLKGLPLIGFSYSSK